MRTAELAAWNDLDLSQGSATRVRQVKAERRRLFQLRCRG
jgi:hypothetical protein